MYFSKKRIKILAETINTSTALLCKITFDIGWCADLELGDTIDILFQTWNIFWEKQYHSRYYAFEGMLRRFLITCDEKQHIFKPHFSLFALLPKKNTDRENVEHRLYLAWVNALKQHKEAAVNFEILKKEHTEEAVRVFCTADSIANDSGSTRPTRVGRTVSECVKKAKGMHRFFSVSGLFKDALNRHVSVQNNG